MTRRPVWQLLAGAAAVLLLLLTGCTGLPIDGRQVRPEHVAFETPLAIPPLAPSRLAADGTRVFDLTAQEGTTEFRPGVQTRTWGFNGDYLGPTLRASRGEQIAAEVTNGLDEPTSVHWHGMRLPAEMDGGPHQEVAPGQTWRPTWRIDQPAGTLWYHPHPHGATEKHVYRGLAGMFIIDDDDGGARNDDGAGVPGTPGAGTPGTPGTPGAHGVAAGLPAEYGVDDIPVMVQDKKFAEDGSLSLDSEGNEPGLLGSTVMANGTIGAYQEVTTERVRLRLLNASTARTYAFGFEDNRDFHLVGTDGGLLPAPHQDNRVRLSPGERAEIVVELEPGERTMLRSYPPELGDVAASAAFGGEDTFDVLQLRAAGSLRPSPPVPGVLAETPRLRESDASTVREFTLAVRQINGRRMDMDRIDETVPAGATEIWQVRTLDPLPHNFHIHDVQFQVQSIDGNPPPPELAGSKDTVYLEPGRTYRLIMRFGEHSDSDSPYMFHCHLLRHEDEGLMGQFVVVDPGTNQEQPAGEEPPEDQPPEDQNPNHEHHH